MSANRGLFGRNRRPVQGEAPGTDGGKTSKARKKEEDLKGVVCREIGAHLG